MWTFLIGSKLVRMFGGILVVVGAFWLWGEINYRNGRADVVDRIEEARGRAAEQKKVIEDEIRSLDTDDLVSRAAEWLR